MQTTVNYLLGLLLLALPFPFFAQQDYQALIKKSISDPVWKTTDPELDEYTLIRAAEVELQDWQNADKLALNLFPDLTLFAERQRTEYHPNGSEVWVGKLEDQKYGYALFAQTDGIFWGKIQTDAGQHFAIRPMPESTAYQLIQIDNGGVMDENCEKDPSTQIFQNQPETPLAQKIVGVCEAGATCASLTLDVMVVYTTDARSALGGSDAAAQSAIALAVAELNTICDNSNIIHEYALVHSAAVSYTESGDITTELPRLRDADDGFMDEVYDWRDAYYADLVSLVIDDGGCGYGNVNTNTNVFSSSTAFSVVDDICLVFNKSLSHEIGHNMGFRHDRYAYGSTPSNVCDYAWGWVNPDGIGGSSSEQWRTTMAYNSQCSDNGFNCTRIPHFSNPDVNYNGDPTGSSIGNTDEANNAYLLDRSACLVDPFRVPVNCSGSCSLYQASANYNPSTSGGPGNTTVINITETFTPLNPGGEVEICVVYRGDHNAASETFDVLDESGNSLGFTPPSNDCEIPNRICFTSTVANYNSWITDGTITITLDPTSTAINPGLCSGANRASVEILATQAPLPVEFTRFEAALTGNDILLFWETAVEENSDFFEVQHSLDGVNFMPAAQIDAAGESQKLLTYAHTYKPARSGIHYFRIRQVDQDGSFQFTETRSVRVDEVEPLFSIHPNPVREQLYIAQIGETPWNQLQIEVYDLAGKRLEHQSEANGPELTLSTNNWPGGIYFIRISDKKTGKVLESTRVVKAGR
ncbi:MAG: T9SS type A sorting domain-containing protein [Bacteroidetes bacterium]|nr:T9SS type A sorting domain-containing protein [Bacteroidota bacterium]